MRRVRNHGDYNLTLSCNRLAAFRLNSSAADYFFYRILIKVENHKLISCPVSYTQLDVYKRQTNDGGIGMAQALGAHFLDKDGNEAAFGGGSLAGIETIDLSSMDSRLKETEITVMCDVDNPLCGPKGASAVYGPQKGATPELVELLDNGLGHLADVMKANGLPDLRAMPGAGAAGGLGMGLAAFTGAVLRSGIEAVLEAAGFVEKLDWAHLVITGEGRIDEQSVFGKVPTCISKYASQHKVPVKMCIRDRLIIIREAYPCAAASRPPG